MPEGAVRLRSLPDGIYRGISPTDESSIGVGELYIQIKNGVLRSLGATGSEIKEENSSVEALDNMKITRLSPSDSIVIYTGGMGDLLSPIILFDSEAQQSGKFESLMNKLKDHAQPGLFPRIKDLPQW